MVRPLGIKPKLRSVLLGPNPPGTRGKALHVLRRLVRAFPQEQNTPQGDTIGSSGHSKLGARQHSRSLKSLSFVWRSCLTCADLLRRRSRRPPLRWTRPSCSEPAASSLELAAMKSHPTRRSSGETRLRMKRRNARKRKTSARRLISHQTSVGRRPGSTCRSRRPRRV